MDMNMDKYLEYIYSYRTIVCIAVFYITYYMRFKRYTSNSYVIHIENLSKYDDIFKLILKRPDNFSCVEGQSIYIKLNKFKKSRKFIISTVTQNSIYVVVCIKNDKFSKVLSKLDVGTELFLSGPFGRGFKFKGGNKSIIVDGPSAFSILKMRIIENDFDIHICQKNVSDMLSVIELIKTSALFKNSIHLYVTDINSFTVSNILKLQKSDVKFDVYFEEPDISKIVENSKYIYVRGSMAICKFAKKESKKLSKVVGCENF